MSEDVSTAKKESKEDKLKALMNELGAKPFLKKQDGTAVKVTEDKEVEWTDHDGNKNTLKVPAGSYIVQENNGWCPEIREAEDFEKKNEIVSEKKKEKKPTIGIELVG